MDLPLDAFAASDAPLGRRLAVAGGIVRAVAALHARGRVHGALHPARVRVLDGETVVLVPPGDAAPCVGPLARAGFDAPEVARGARPSRGSDAFAAGALAYLVLARVPPFDAPDPLEAIRCVLFADPPPLRLHAPGVPVEVEAEIAAVLERRPRRRHGLEELLRVLEGPTGTATSTSTTTPTATTTAISVSRLRARALAAVPRSPIRRAGLVAIPVVVLGLLYMPGNDGSLSREVAAAIERGDHAAAARTLDLAARDRPGDPLVEKLRGDLACARGAAEECLRRYRVALAARPDMREDASLRRNVRRLLGRDHGCGTRRAAANLLGEIRDPDALPALEEARRSAGLFAFLCTGDSIDRAIAATRASDPAAEAAVPSG